MGFEKIFEDFLAGAWGGKSYRFKGGIGFGRRPAKSGAF
jgi:hypothetical protein